MKMSLRHNDRCFVQTAQHRPPREEGQSMLEMTVGVIFLLIIVLILFEMAMLFYSYIAVLNASREGAVYASAYPEMNATEYQRYENVTTAEARAAGLNTDPAFFVVDAPETPDGNAPLQPIIVRVHYQLINPTQGIILPVMGRMGLFQSVWMTGETKMPIR
jgi:Zn-dependent protease with chaperone function